MPRKLGEIWMCDILIYANRQTDKHTDTPITILLDAMQQQPRTKGNVSISRIGLIHDERILYVSG